SRPLRSLLFLPSSRCALSVFLPLSSSSLPSFCSLFFFNDPATTEIYTLSLHDALPISRGVRRAARSPRRRRRRRRRPRWISAWRSEEHTSELQSRFDLVCRLLLEKKKKKRTQKLKKMKLR